MILDILVAPLRAGFGSEGAGKPLSKLIPGSRFDPHSRRPGEEDLPVHELVLGTLPHILNRQGGSTRFLDQEDIGLAIRVTLLLRHVRQFTSRCRETIQARDNRRSDEQAVPLAEATVPFHRRIRSSLMTMETLPLRAQPLELAVGESTPWLQALAVRAGGPR